MTNHQIEPTPHNLATPSQRWHYLQTQATNPFAHTLFTHYGRHAWTLVETQLAKHPFLQERPTFPYRYTHAIWYHILTHAHQHNTLPTRSLHQLTQTLNLPHETVRSWLLLNKISRLQLSINKLDQGHQRLINSYPPEALKHRLNPSTVYTLFQPLHNSPNHTPNRAQLLATAIQRLNATHTLQAPVVFAELRPYHKNGPHWLHTIAQEIHTNLLQIQNHLNPCINGKTLRIGLVRNILYIWEKDENPDNWLNIYNDEHFHLPSIRVKRDLVEKARCHLLIQKQALSRLISQLNTRHRDSYHPASRIQALHYNFPYLLGSSLHFILDTIDQSLDTVQIEKIGRGSHGVGYIQGPRFPQGEELNEFRARLLAIVLSDGSIDKAGILKYSENSRSRRKYVKNLFGSALGTIDTYERGTNLRFPAVVGRIMHRWGVPIGDKIIQSVRLPLSILNQSTRVRRAYLEEVVPEDGTFGIYSGKVWFKIGRTKILDAGDKSTQYQFAALIPQELKDFVANFTTKNNPMKEKDRLVSFVVTLTWGELEDLSNTPEYLQQSDQIRRLQLLIRNNPPELLVDEKAIADSLGIKCRMVPIRITLFETGRISVSWELVTRGRNEALKWALLAPPSSGRKRKQVEQWLSTNLG